MGEEGNVFDVYKQVLFANIYPIRQFLILMHFYLAGRTTSGGSCKQHVK